jgi:hypothetical protein
MTQQNLKRMTAEGCNGSSIVLLFAALALLMTQPNQAIAVAVVAAACVIAGTLLRFQAMFEKWEVPHVSFHMKQTGIRGKRGTNEHN